MARSVGVSLSRADHVPWADIKVSGPIRAGQLSAGFSGGPYFGECCLLRLPETPQSASAALLGPVMANPIRHIQQ